MPSPIETVLPTSDLTADIDYFTRELGMRLDRIFPADDPAVAVLSASGVRVRLERGSHEPPGHLRIESASLTRTRTASGLESDDLTSPGGTRISVHAPTDPEAPAEPGRFEPRWVVNRAGLADPESGDTAWVTGRASMQYRDLIPDRLGGRYIASHIRIPNGGPVPDYVHYHRIRFQMIYCYRGWVQVVYEDQGEPFTMLPGDCVLQPPGIRHQVLTCSDGLEVIELGCPAQHETLVEHEIALPTGSHRPDRDFGGQRFVRHERAQAPAPGLEGGWRARDLGFATATRGLATARVLSVDAHAGLTPAPQTITAGGDSELEFRFLLEGRLTLLADDREAVELRAGDSFVVPPGSRYSLTNLDEGLQLLAVSVSVRR